MPPQPPIVGVGAPPAAADKLAQQLPPLEAWKAAPTCVELTEAAVVVALSNGALLLLDPTEGTLLAEMRSLHHDAIASLGLCAAERLLWTGSGHTAVMRLAPLTEPKHAGLLATVMGAELPHRSGRCWTFTGMGWQANCHRAFAIVEALQVSHMPYIPQQPTNRCPRP